MGHARYLRGSELLKSAISATLADRRNSLDTKTGLWAEMIENGHILTWQHPRGGIMSLGPYQTAVPNAFARYAVLSKHGDKICATAWAAACEATAIIGRRVPREAE